MKRKILFKLMLFLDKMERLYLFVFIGNMVNLVYFFKMKFYNFNYFMSENKFLIRKCLDKYV